MTNAVVRSCTRTWCLVPISALVLFALCVQGEVITRPPGVDHIVGTWTYSPPSAVPTGNGSFAFGQYLYVSPMGAECRRNLTIHVGGTTLWACQVGHVSQAYLDSHECIPDALMMPAYIVDKLNSKNILDIPGTCIQISASHYNYGSANQETFTEDIIEATKKFPRKHGVATSAHGDKTYFMATAAKMVGLPIIDGNWMAADSIRHSDTSEFPTLLRTLSDRRGFLQQWLDVLPQGFALLTDDATGSGTQTAIIKQTAEDAGKQILYHAIVPAMVGDYNRTAFAVNDFLIAIRKKGIRYVLFSAGPSVQPVFACQIHRLGIPTAQVQVVVLGAASSAELSASIAKEYCSIQDIMPVCENGGWIGVQACTASTYVEDDFLVNQVTGQGLPAGISRGLDGSVWTASKSLNVSARPGCQDQDDAAMRNPLLQKLIGKVNGEPFTCQDLAIFGQSVRYSFITIIAELCPVTVCNYNMYSYACRIGCACQDPALTTTSGKPLCTSFKQLPRGYNVAEPFQIAEFRCTGKGCRELPYYASAFAFWNMGLEYTFERPNNADWENVPANWDGGSPAAGMVYKGVAGYCRARKYGNCGYLGRGSPAKYIGMTLSDAFWAYALAYKCIYDRAGEVGLDRLESFNYVDPWVTNTILSCLVESVEYEGSHGRVNFKFHRSPLPGYSINTVNQPAYSTKRGVMTCGHVGRHGPVISARVFARDDYTQCPAGIGDFAPLRVCPPNTSIVQTVRDTDESLQAKMPLGIPENCPAGHYPLAEGEVAGVARLDSCVPCPPGAYKSSAGPERCSACASGEWSGGLASTICERCSRGTYTPAANWTDINPWIRQEIGFSSCMNCTPGKANPDPGTAFCMLCATGRYSSSLGAYECSNCELGEYSAMEGISACTKCIPGRTTQYPGSRLASKCICGSGQFQDGVCKACPEGMNCPLGSNMNSTLRPELLPGFYSSTLEPLKVYKCLSDGYCPGGEPDSCGPHMRGINCGKCDPSYYRVGINCEPCAGSSAIILVVILGLFVMVGIFLHKLNRKAAGNEKFESIKGQIAFDIALQFCFTLATFSRLSFSWPSAFQSVLGSGEVLLFNIEILRLPCLYEPSLTSDYAQSLLVPVVIVATCFAWIPASILLHGCLRKIKPIPMLQKFKPIPLDVVINGIGMIMQAFFIPIALLVVSFLQCYESPCGDRTLLRSSYSICNEGEYLTAIPLAIVAFLVYVVGLPAAMIWAIVMAPVLIRKEGFFTRCRFLLFRWHPTRWWYTASFVTRSLCIACVTVVVPDDGFLQFLLMFCIFMLVLVAHLFFRPYNNDRANALETLEHFVLLLVLMIGSWFIGGVRDDSSLGMAFSSLLCGLVVSFLLVAAGVFAFALWTKNFRDTLGKHTQATTKAMAVRLANAVGVVSAIPAEKVEELVMQMYDKEVGCVVALTNFVGVELLQLNGGSMRTSRLPSVKPQVSVDSDSPKPRRLSRMSSNAYHDEFAERSRQFRTSFTKAESTDDKLASSSQPNDVAVLLGSSEPYDKCYKSGNLPCASAPQISSSPAILGVERTESDLLDIAEGGRAPAGRSKPHATCLR